MLRRPSVCFQFPVSKNARNIEFEMFLNHGEVVFDNGLSVIIRPGQGHMIFNKGFDTTTRIISHGAGINWIQQDEGFWESLKNVSEVNFHGEFENDVICYLVQKCSDVKNMSFTYFIAPIFETILRSITSSKITELTAHLNRTSSYPEMIFPELANLGNRIGCKFKRLMLFFGTGYNGKDMGVIGFQSFRNILDEGASVFVLFEFEKPGLCMNTLFTHLKYQRAGKMVLAKNCPRFFENAYKIISERYYLYQKIIGGNTFSIGCKKKSYEPQKFVQTRYDALSSKYFDKVPEIKLFDIYAFDQQHIVPRNSQEVLGDLADPQRRNYSPQNYAAESRTPCCSPSITHRNDINKRPFCEPIWDTTRVAQLVYLERDTLFVFSNGLIFQLQNMDLETGFFKKMAGKACSRMEIICTTQNRRWIEANGLIEFFKSVCHVEFCGFWFSGPLINAVERLPKNTCTILSMMRLKIDRKPSVYTLQAFGRKAASNAEKYGDEKGLFHNVKNEKGLMTKYFYDSRDTVECSLASVMNGLLRSGDIFHEMDSVFICARNVSDNTYWTNWDSFIQNMTMITVNGAEITIVVHEFIDNFVMKNLGLVYGKDVLVPGIYSSRHGNPEWCGIMRQFSTLLHGRTWNIIIPHHDLRNMLNDRFH